MLNWEPSPVYMPAISKAIIKASLSAASLENLKGTGCCYLLSINGKDDFGVSTLCQDNCLNKMSLEFWCWHKLYFTTYYMMWRKPYLAGHLSTKFSLYRKCETIKYLRGFLFTEDLPVPFPTPTLNLSVETWNQWCAGKCLTASLSGENNAMICSICQFLCCKYSHHGPLQVTKVTDCRVGKRCVHSQLFKASARQLQCTTAWNPGAAWSEEKSSVSLLPEQIFRPSLLPTQIPLY